MLGLRKDRSRTALIKDFSFLIYGLNRKKNRDPTPIFFTADRQSINKLSINYKSQITNKLQNTMNKAMNKAQNYRDLEDLRFEIRK
jgi:hypothetical protein